jgi:P2-related tail formation protein
MESTPEQLSAANREIRHLQEMIAALRTELEAMRLEKDHAAQQMVADTQIENQQFKDTINALREELEKLRFDAREQVSRAETAASDEINQLKATVTALRHELEGLHQRTGRTGHASDDTPGASVEPHHAG